MNTVNVVYASKLRGVVLDCNVADGSRIGGTGTPTDNWAPLQEFLNTASPTNPIKLILDGGTLISQTLRIATLGHTTIEGLGWDTGIFVKAGSNCTAIDNGDIPGTIPTTMGANVHLKNFFINGNRGNGTTGNCTSGDPRMAPGGAWKMNVWFANINHLVFEKMFIWDSPTYGIDMVNCNDTHFDHCVVYNPCTTFTLNNDCIHFDGPSGVLFVGYCYVGNNNSDDGVAINAPEGYPNGVLDSIVITNNVFAGCLHAVRAYGQVDGQVGSVNISNNIMNTSECAILLGLFNGVASPDINGRTIHIHNNNASAGKRFLEIDNGCGDISLFNNTWYNVGNTAISFIYCATAAHVSSLRTGNNAVYREFNFSANIPLLYSNFAAVTIDYMSIDGYYLLNKQGTTGNGAVGAALSMGNITIGRLHVAALDYGGNVTTLATGYSTIGALTGPGIFPSSQVATKTANYTLLVPDGTIFADATTAAFNLSLPTSAYVGQTHILEKIDNTNHVVTIVGTIDGVVNPVLTAKGQHKTIKWDGAAWRTVSATGIISKGQATLAGGTVTVTAPAVQATSIIMLTTAVPSATIGVLTLGTIVPGASFVINSTSTDDTSVINWGILA